jgi:hypothetical protein
MEIVKRYGSLRRKGKSDLNTALKSEAAILFCGRMSGSRHGSWRYLFVPQPKFQKAMQAGISTLADLNAAVAVESTSRQLQLISLDDAKVENERFKTLLPGAVLVIAEFISKL